MWWSICYCKNPKIWSISMSTCLNGLKCFHKNSITANYLGGAIKSGTMSNQKLAEALHKPIIRKLKKGKVYYFFKYNIWTADLADIQLIRQYKKGIQFIVSLISLVNMQKKEEVALQ